MESTLSAQFADLQGDIGFFLGFGRGAANGEAAWTTTQQSSIDRCTKGGLRNFYFCEHDWSFLKPVAGLSLAAGASTLALPDDFSGVSGQITLSAASATAGTAWWPLDFTGVGRLYQQQAQYPSTTGRPQLCCEEPIKGTSATAGQRFQLRLWPVADQAYTLQFQYQVAPDYLSGAFPFVYGGPQHAETALESCLAVAEKLLDDEATVHALEFEKRLAVSQELDRRNKPQALGYNRDLSDLRDRQYPRQRWWGESQVTVGGVQY